MNYINTVLEAKKLYILFLDVVKYELDKLKIYDLTKTEAVLLYSIGKNKFTVCDLISQHLFLGNNMSYQLKKMINSGYVENTKSIHDKRLVFIQLTDKGQRLWTKLEYAIQNHMKILRKELEDPDICTVQSSLLNMNRCLRTLLNESTLH